MHHSINVTDILTLHDEHIKYWKKEETHLFREGFYALVEENHFFNFELWTTEDKARRDDMGYEFVYRAKREIDYLNQQRNNRMEAIDKWLYDALTPSAHSDCPLHSETPGMMIDRLSILALKIHHMEIQTRRENVDETHRQNCELKYQTLLAQRQQLASCLEHFLDEVQAKKRSFKLYHQFKMYNDTALNPELYENIR